MPRPKGPYRREKHPVRIEDGARWRWVSPDPPTSDGPHELPKAIFDRLPGGPSRFRWPYRTYDEARFAAVLAVAGFILDRRKRRA